MSLKRRMMVTREGAYFLFVLAFVLTGAVLREINLMLVLAGMMLGALFYNARVARRMTQRLTVRRRLPEFAIAGELVAVELVANSPTRCAGLRIEDAIQWQGTHSPPLGAGASAAFASIDADEPATAHYRIVLPRRGRYSFGPVVTRTSYPFGLVRRTVEHDQAGTLIVYPRLGTLTPRFSARVEEAASGTQRQRRQSYADGDFYGLRDYHSGDSRRHVHWRTSARRGSLMVRQFERNQNQDLVLLVDLWQPNHASDEDRKRVELAVSCAATIASHACRRGGCQLTVALLGPQASVVGRGASMAYERDIMGRLAEAHAYSIEPPVKALGEAIEQAPRGAMCIVVTSREGTPSWTSSLYSAVRPGRQAILDRMLCISTHSKDFSELFQIAANQEPHVAFQQSRNEHNPRTFTVPVRTDQSMKPQTSAH
jgi:uncharacterized protein (DUF58 family)